MFSHSKLKIFVDVSRLIYIVLFVISIQGCANYADGGKKFLIEEDLADKGLFERGEICVRFDEKEKARQLNFVKAYCKQFDQQPLIFSHKFKPNSFHTGEFRVSTNFCFTKFTCVNADKNNENGELRAWAELDFEVDEHGNVTTVEISKSSGSAHLDKKILTDMSKKVIDIKSYPMGQKLKRKIFVRIDEQSHLWKK